LLIQFCFLGAAAAAADAADSASTVVAAASCFFLLRTALGSNVLCPYKEGVSATTLQLSTTDVFGS